MEVGGGVCGQAEARTTSLGYPAQVIAAVSSKAAAGELLRAVELKFVLPWQWPHEGGTTWSQFYKEGM